jgi:hypothetical protein
MERLKKILPFLLYSCKRVSQIISKTDDEVTFKEKIILLYHGTICRTCHKYKIQSTVLDKTLSKNFENTNNTSLSDSKKIEIVEAIKKH